jgi:cyclophilin family peptidyl-prolyl cis-trans isomerase
MPASTTTTAAPTTNVARRERIKASVIAPGEDIDTFADQNNTTTSPQHHHQGGANSSTTNFASFSSLSNNINASISPSEEWIRRRSLDLDEKRTKEWLEYQRLYRQESSSHPKVFLDLIFGVDGTNNSQRLVIELFSDVCPKTCENFRELCLGHGGWIEIDKQHAGSANNNNNNTSATTTIVKIDYADTRCSRILPGIGALFGEIPSPLTTPSIPASAAQQQSSTVSSNSTTNGVSYLPDENFALRHNSKGIVTMVGHGPNTIGSQFMILFDRAPQFDFKYVPFGRVIEGLPVLEKLEKHQTTITNIPTHPITVSLAGALNGKKPHSMTPAQGAPLVSASGRMSSSHHQNQSGNNNNNFSSSSTNATPSASTTQQQQQSIRNGSQERHG